MAETVTIAALGAGGDGIATVDETRVFVPFTLPGETVEIERNGARAKAVRIVDPSPDRVAPACRHFGTCGGCALQHMDRTAYLAWKRAVVERSFALHGIEAEVAPIVPIAPGTRRRAVFSAVATARGIVLGFHRRGSEEIVPVEECPVLLPAIAGRLALFRDIAAAALRPGKRARLTVVAADNGLDIALDGAGRIDRRRADALGRFGAEPAVARLTIDGSEIVHNRQPEIAAGSAALLPVPGGFLQAAAPAEAALAAAIIAHVGAAAPVADLFSGIGTFALRLAARAPVTAVEGEAALVAGLEAAARRARGLKPVTARRRDLFANPMAPAELAQFGAVVFDPPAAGAKAQAAAIAASTVGRVAAVSCNPATLARDAAILLAGGYRLTGVTPVDQFLYSAEIEAVATFIR